jgi:hypothetical protein
VPQAEPTTIDHARNVTNGQWRVVIAAAGRMRAVFEARAMPLPLGTALLARVDRYGTLLSWPDGRSYRTLVPGTLRTLMGERRVDAMPAAPGGSPRSEGEGEKLGLKTRKVRLTSPYGSVQLELAPVPEAGEGAQLFCRTLLDIAGIDPSAPTCVSAEPEVVLAADYRWQEGKGVRFEATALNRQPELRSDEMAVPPPRSRSLAADLPALAYPSFFGADELGSFRSAAATEPNPRDPDAPREGPPWSEQLIAGPKNGRYTVQWRSFLGDVVSDSAELDLPARVRFGAPESAPDGGPG